MLGNTLPEIAGEKAGIIKPNVPAVVSERQTAVAHVFERVAAEKGSPLRFASEEWEIANLGRSEQHLNVGVTRHDSAEITSYALDLMGRYQVKNLPAVLCSVDELRRQGFGISDADVKHALANVQQLTGLMGRWQTVATHPSVICDTGHNADGWREVLANIEVTPHRALHMVIGMMRDKEPAHILPM